MIRRTMIAATIAGVVFASGCRQRCCLNDPGRRPNPYRPQAPNSPFLLPPAGVPTTPGPTPLPPPPGGGNPFIPGVGPAPVVDPRNYPPPSFDLPPNPSPSPSAKPAPEVLLPDPLPGSGPSRSSLPLNPGIGVLGTPGRPQAAEPKLAANSPATIATGLPGFVRVKDGFASGRKPALEGFDTLKRANYRTVVYMHAVGADTSAAKDVAEKRGLKFVPIETTPEKLADAVTQFNALAADKAVRPVYVFDDDGVRAGTVWFVHFRTSEAMNDDAARIRATPLGLTDQGDEAKAFAVATQRYLETR